LRQLVPLDKLHAALAPDRHQALVEGMVGNPDLRPAGSAPEADRAVAAELAEQFGQTVFHFSFFDLHVFPFVFPVGQNSPVASRQPGIRACGKENQGMVVDLTKAVLGQIANGNFNSSELLR
jgi:hypothetical protein